MYKPYNSRILNDEIICAYSQPHLIEETPEQQKHRQYILKDFQEDLKVALLKSGIVQPNINIDTLILTMGHYAQIQAYTKTLAMHYEQAFRQVWQRYFEGVIHSFKHIYDFDKDVFKPLITPFYPHLVKRTLGDVGNIDIVSFGTSSYGYDARLHEEVYTFTNSNGGEVDPKNFDRSVMVCPKVFDSDNGKYVVIPPNGFLLGKTIEHFNIPRNVNVICLGKSTMARCSLVVNVTPLEAGWSGTVTLEISNTCSLPVRVYLNEGVCQFIFTESSEPCKTSYSDRKGKYMNQVDVTMSKV